VLTGIFSALVEQTALQFLIWLYSHSITGLTPNISATWSTVFHSIPWDHTMSLWQMCFPGSGVH
jgi:hypothetical protein